MRNYLTLIIVKKAVTFASALFAVGFVYFHGAMNQELVRARLEIQQKDSVIATLAVKTPAAAVAPVKPVSDVARIFKHAVPVKVTCYSNEAAQTDSTPDICAWGNKFTEYFRGYKTIAISRDLLEKGWKFKDVIYVPGVGKCIVWDLMNPRLKKSIDLALYDTSKFGTFKSVAVPLGEAES